MTKTDLSTKVLLVRKMLAEKATPGPWLINDRNTSTPFDISIKNGTCFCQIVWGTKRQDITHIAANDPPTVIATIDELLQLREENARLEANMATLRDALKHILDLSTSECIALRAADIDINLNINEIRIATRDALDAARKVVEE